MKTKFSFTFLLAAIVLLVMPNYVHADSTDGADNPVIYIDTTNGGSATLNPVTLESRVAQLAGLYNYDIKELYIDSTVSGSLNADDILFLRRLHIVEVIDVADTITVSDAGDDFQKYNTNLREVTFPAVTFGISAFYGCTNLASVNLPNAETFGSQAMSGCHNLSSVNMPNATSFGTYAFQNCLYGLTDISLPSAQYFAGYSFNNCRVLKNVDLPLAHTFGNRCFGYCYALERIYLPSASSFTENSFMDCYKLTNAALPDAENMGYYPFRGCTGLQSITFGETVPTVNAWYSDFNFDTNVYVPSAQLSAYDSDGVVPNDNKWEGMDLYAHNTSIEYDPNDADGGSVPVDASVYVLGDDVVLMDNVNSLIKEGFIFIGWNTKPELNGIHYDTGDTIMFVCGIKLYAEFEFDDTGIVNITSESGTTLDPGELQARVEAVMGGANIANDVLQLTIDETVSGNFNADDIAYINSLVNLEILNVGDTMSVDCNIGNNFLRYAPNIQEVTFPGENFGDDSFRELANLTSVNLFEAVTFGARSFAQCTSLVNVDMPNVTSIGNYCFTQCTSLVGLTLPKAQTFGDQVFYACDTLATLTLPSAVSFGINSFNCSSLSQLTFGGNIPAVESWEIIFTSGSLIVPANAIDAYDADSAPDGDGMWNGFTIYSNTTTLCTVTYDVSNATGTAPVDALSPYGYGAMVTVLGKTGSFSNPGYNFIGWNTESDGSGTHYDEGDTFTILTDTTLYSQWEMITYTVTYDLNGIAGDPPVDDNLYPQGSAFTTASTVYYRDGFDDTGWNTQSDGLGVRYDKNDTYEITSDLYLYVQWQCALTYDGNGADSGAAPEEYHHNENHNARVDGSGTLVKEGYAFAGWNTEPDGSGTTYHEDEYITMTGHTTLYAVWNEPPNRITTVDAQDIRIVQIGDTYSIDLTAIFEDAEVDELTFEVSFNGGSSYNSTPSTSSFTSTTKGKTELTFRCSDGYSNSVDIYVVELWVVDSDIVEDGVIDLLDIAELAQQYNTAYAAYDQTFDDFINLFDMVVMAKFVD